MITKANKAKLLDVYHLLNSFISDEECGKNLDEVYVEKDFKEALCKLSDVIDYVPAKRVKKENKNQLCIKFSS